MCQPKMTRAEKRRLKFAQQQEKRRNDYCDSEYAMPPECDLLCRFRSCYNKYENKGSFSVGRGYTSYHEDFRPACGTRLNHGCPFTRGGEQDNFDMREALEWLGEKLEQSQDKSIKWQKKRDEMNCGVDKSHVGD